MGEPAELTGAERAEVRAKAIAIVDAVTNDESVLRVLHDYDRDYFLQLRTPVQVEEAIAIDSTKLGDVEANDEIEYALTALSQEVIKLRAELQEAVTACRLDLAERQAFRAWVFKGRDKVVEKALEIAKHWGDQGGVNGKLLDDLAELAGHPTRGYRRDT